MIDLSPYRGSWVALAGSQIIAVGETAEKAYRPALERDSSERFYLSYVEVGEGEGLQFSPLLDDVRPHLERRGEPVYLVGGAVRDAILGRMSHDLDFVVPRDAISQTFRLADAIGAPAYVLDSQRDTGRIVLPGEKTMLDFACYRGPDLFADLHDRDFTINALAIPATGRTRASIIDPTNGLVDLASGLIRLAHPDALNRDPARALRAVRLAAELGFTMTPDTEAAVMVAASSLQEVSSERIRDEVIKMIQAPAADLAIEQMEALGLLEVVLPEAAALAPVPQSPPHHEPVLQHTISVLRWLERIEGVLFTEKSFADPALELARTVLAPYLEALNIHRERTVDGGLDGRTILRLAALFHDVGKQMTSTVDEDGRYRFFGHAEAGAELIMPRLRALTLSNDAITQIRRIVMQHMRPLLLAQAQGAQPSRRATFRYFKASGANGLDVGLLALADHLATYDGPGEDSSWQTLLALVAALFDFYFECYEETVKPPMLVNGRDLMAHLQLAPGPEIGRILRLIEENQAAGEITTREQALRFAESLQA